MSEKFSINISTDLKLSKRVAHVREMMTVQKEMGKGFNLQITQAQRFYTILEIMFEFMFVKVT